MGKTALRTVGGILEESADNPRAVIGGNMPPEAPYDAHKRHIDDLFETAQGFLDGEPIANQAQADAVGKLLSDAREARAAAEAQRKIEAKPFDDGKAAVQALWTPLTDEKKGRCALIAETCKKALAPYLQKLDDEKRAIEAAARAEADRKTAEAQAAMQAADATDLAAREAAEALLKDAGKAEAAAKRAANDKAMVAGGARSVSLRTVWKYEVEDRRALANHVARTRPDEFAAMMEAWVATQVSDGVRVIPGVRIFDEKAPV